MSNKSGQKFNPQEKWTQIHLATMDNPAWRALSPMAQALFPWLRLEFKGPKANNNGRLQLSQRDAARKMGVKKAETIGKAFHDLQAKGFVKVHQCAALGIEGKGKSFQFEITDLAMPGPRNRPSYLFKEWEEGKDFAVSRAAISNPSGRSDKNSHPSVRGTPVPDMETKNPSLYH